ncbi:hypothetical protein [Megasphaera sueciensis]|uniref:hyaluronate lyase N-terminal domain-containing protein n=1 Tax=Megasphaera sueciensis TaxID=349094 RepID=UPI003D024265
MAKRTFSESTVQHKTGTAAQWTSVNPVLAKGEIGAELDAGRIKIGDGVTTWANLPYIGQSSTAPVGHIQQQYVLEPGYLKLDGSTVNRATYADLWAWAQANGLVTESPSNYQFGTGDGATFVLPNHLDRVWQGGSDAGLKNAGLPNITSEAHYVSVAYTGWGQGSFGAMSLSIDAGVSSLISGNTWGGAKIGFDASQSNAIYGASTTVQPPAIVLIPQIKY